jgi:predicted ATPase
VDPVRTRLEAARSRGFSRFVGRADEMSALELALEHASAGHGQVLGVVGEAGVGKSRLCLEFVERCRAKGLPVYEAHCPAHGRMLPFLPFLELLRAYFGVSERDGDQLAREKIAGRLLLLERGFEASLPLVFDFLGVRDPDRALSRLGPEARQRQLFDFIRALVRSWSRHEPTVLLIDDLHWIDPGSDACLAQLVEAIGGARTLLLVNFRPEYRAEWLGRSYYQQLPLVPLGAGAIGEMLGDLLGADPSVAVLCDRIRERTGGNPFFVEEVVHSLVESGIVEGSRGRHRLTRPGAELEIPPTVQAVLAARIDRLPEREKRVLQTAAVIGGSQVDEGALPIRSASSRVESPGVRTRRRRSRRSARARRRGRRSRGRSRSSASRTSRGVPCARRRPG